MHGVPRCTACPELGERAEGCRAAGRRLQDLVDLQGQAVKVGPRDEVALDALQAAPALLHGHGSLALAVHQVHPQGRRQVHL